MELSSDSADIFDWYNLLNSLSDSVNKSVWVSVWEVGFFPFKISNFFSPSLKMYSISFLEKVNSDSGFSFDLRFFFLRFECAWVFSLLLLLLFWMIKLLVYE